MELRNNNIFNKKGFTLLELLIAVSIFGVISVMTFSVINYVPKLAKSESSQFSERTDVRRAVTEITDTIQSASKVTLNSMEFELPNGDKVIYKHEGGNVNKYINGVSHGLMESMAEFQISSISEHLFNIHVKTAKEGKVYDFKVEKRRDIRTKTEAVISTISPTTAVFDKRNPDDIDITITLNGNDLVELRNGSYTLESGEDYTVSGDTVTIKSGYLSGLNVGTITIVFDVTGGKDPELTIEIKNTIPQLKIEGNAYTDDIARMNYPGNLQPDPYDKTWVITVTNCTVDDAKNIDKDDLSITGLPAGINYTAAKGEGNTIVITLKDSASTPVTTTRTVEVVVKSTAVTGTAADDSDPIKVFMLPGGAFASPERNLLFANDVYIKNKVTITGDIVIGRGYDTTEIGDNPKINGYIYADSSISTKNDGTFGSPEKWTKVFVNGSADLGNKIVIYGDIFYRDNLNTKNGTTIYGRAEKRAVVIPELKLPTLKDEQWYAQNGYTIVKTSSENVPFASNGKYYFRTEYRIQNLDKRLDNVRIVGKANIEFTSHFKGSGVIFAPNGTVHFKNGCTFEGICVTNRTDLETDCTLKYTRYGDLPFDTE